MPNLHPTWLSVIQLQDKNETKRTDDYSSVATAIKNISKMKGHIPPGSSRTVVSSHQGEGGHEQRNPPCHHMVRSEKHMQMLGTLYMYVYTTKHVFVCVYNDSHLIMFSSDFFHQVQVEIESNKTHPHQCSPVWNKQPKTRTTTAIYHDISLQRMSSFYFDALQLLEILHIHTCL